MDDEAFLGIGATLPRPAGALLAAASTGGKTVVSVNVGGGGCFSFGVQTSGEYIFTMFGCV